MLKPAGKRNELWEISPYAQPQGEVSGCQNGKSTKLAKSLNLKYTNFR